ncbi:hypothetical protein NPX13_g7482 [Xylaria arbuscula]|uniref:DUF7587 domain-containing protein n=1 Tax=Xylaria arbuscula TaxID=114810 RepID=A0A9W8NA89_9PEZI|nr:hypothetical protein NPX13_g7482 [Xylaria arbuscula]
MRIVPTEVFQVPLFGKKKIEWDVNPEYMVFVVASTVQPHYKFKIWWTKVGYAILKAVYPDLPEYDEEGRHGGFVRGRPMIKVSVNIRTCGGSERPRTLYRVTFDEQPHDGIKARGYGQVEVTPWHFQMFVDKHMNWSCRDPSPFMSTINDWIKVKQIIRILELRGKTGIRVYKFRTSGAGWDHKKQRLFHVPRLGRYFDNFRYQTVRYMQHEYLLESHIPPESIRKVRKIKDTDYRPEPKKRKAVEDISGQEKKPRVCSIRSTDFRREG